jgi:hypothetical protein
MRWAIACVGFIGFDDIAWKIAWAIEKIVEIPVFFACRQIIPKIVMTTRSLTSVKVFLSEPQS